MRYEKFKEFVNDDENGLVVRLGMVFLGIIFGTFFILLSTLFENQAATTAFLVFGYVTYFSFLAGAGIWYLVENG